MKYFLRGMASINLFPAEKQPIKFTPLSIQDMFKKSLERVGNAMYYAIDIVDREVKESENDRK